MTEAPRVAFFPDSFHEINGVARTSRELEAFARRHQFPMLCVRAGPATAYRQEDHSSILELKRSGLSFPLDQELAFDPLFWRHTKRVKEAVSAFQADVLHITGPSDVGQLGAYIAHALRIPLVASWHTNLHEYAGRRLERLVLRRSKEGQSWIGRLTEHHSLSACLHFYRLARVGLAPNKELVHLLNTGTGKPTFLMRRGIDTQLFSPDRRDVSDGTCRLGFVGRLRPEKNIRFLAQIEQALIDAGLRQYRFVIVGDGSERKWMESHLHQAEFTGVITGEKLARAYANMDLFVFPSRTDTFGNVILEAMASGVPPVVTSCGGPHHLVDSGRNGFVAADDNAFCEAVKNYVADPNRFASFRAEALRSARAASWDAVFTEVYRAYQCAIESCHSTSHPTTCLPSPKTGRSFSS